MSWICVYFIDGDSRVMMNGGVFDEYSRRIYHTLFCRTSHVLLDVLTCIVPGMCFVSGERLLLGVLLHFCENAFAAIVVDIPFVGYAAIAAMAGVYTRIIELGGEIVDMCVLTVNPMSISARRPSTIEALQQSEQVSFIPNAVVADNQLVQPNNRPGLSRGTSRGR